MLCEWRACTLTFDELENSTAHDEPRPLLPQTQAHTHLARHALHVARLHSNLEIENSTAYNAPQPFLPQTHAHTHLAGHAL